MALNAVSVSLSIIELVIVINFFYPHSYLTQLYDDHIGALTKTSAFTSLDNISEHDAAPVSLDINLLNHK